MGGKTLEETSCSRSMPQCRCSTFAKGGVVSKPDIIVLKS